MSSPSFWKPLLDECREKELPCLPHPDNPWFAIEYLATSWFTMEDAVALTADCRRAEVPILLIKRKPCIQVSSIEVVCNEQSAEGG